MSTNTLTTTILGRISVLASVLMFAVAAVLATSATASADDLSATSDDTVETIESTAWPEYGLGDSGVDIGAAKLVLIHHGYDPHMDADHPNEFDAHMEAAVLAYQANADLEETGMLDQVTWEHMRGATFGEYGPGSSGPVVEAVQRYFHRARGRPRSRQRARRGWSRRDHRPRHRVRRVAERRSLHRHQDRRCERD
jgi:hypothetical protein